MALLYGVDHGLHVEKPSWSTILRTVPILSSHSPFLNPAEWLWCKSKARIRRTLRRPVESYFRRKVIPVYKSFAISFNSRDILFITLERYFRHKEHEIFMILTIY